MPELMAQKLNSPNVRVRLRALDTWANEAPPGAVDPFVLAFEDTDERVSARAQQLIEQGMARNPCHMRYMTDSGLYSSQSAAYQEDQRGKGGCWF
ncbi:MAG: hypothetical protein E8D49_01685 [Nitrospira sp.]|nr:MAG: hypothetical protein E8D49_01685 [Nitrospira sp.]